MSESNSRYFGLIIAYLLPGFVALAGLAPLAPVVAGWLISAQTASIGTPVYTILAATAAGMIVSCFRWLTVDQFHALTGAGTPTFNAKALEERPAAFAFLVESHYRYYQFYANMLVAVVWAYAVHRWLATSSLLGIGTDVGIVVLCLALFAGSRDALLKYRRRSRRLVGESLFAFDGGNPMTNGIDHSHGGASKPQQPKPQTKPQQAPSTPAKPPRSREENLGTK